MSEVAEKELICFGQFELSEAKDILIRLKNLGIIAEIRGNEKTCTTRNCKISVDLWGSDQDKEKAAEFFRKEFFKNIGDAKVNLEAMAEVFDPSAETVTCQACAAKFSPNLTECPDCGLCY